MKKKILITGGSSWVALDDVRIITNVFTGRTSLFLAKQFAKSHRVTLLINPERLSGIDVPRSVRAIPYRWHDEFIKNVTGLLRKETFDCIIHAAALADFCPATKFTGKMSSGQPHVISLVPAPKALPLIRKLSRAVIVQFKLESGLTRQALIEKAYASLTANKTDYVVANDCMALRKGLHTRYLIDRRKKSILIPSQAALARVLENEVLRRLPV